MKIYKHKSFHRWARKEGMRDDDIRRAIEEIERGLIDADLGGNVYKKRIGIHGQGRTGRLQRDGKALSRIERSAG